MLALLKPLRPGLPTLLVLLINVIVNMLFVTWFNLLSILRFARIQLVCSEYLTFPNLAHSRVHFTHVPGMLKHELSHSSPN